MNHYGILVLLILGFGFLGGLINFFRQDKDVNGGIGFRLLRALLTGLGASALMPILLNAISSNLLSASESEFIDYYTIGGICLLLSVFSSRLFDNFGDRVVQDVRRVARDVDNVKEELIALTTEKEMSGSADSKEAYQKLNPVEIHILRSIYDTKFTYRSLTGITAETRIDRDTAMLTLEKLESMEFVRKHIRDHGGVRWKLTEKGREVIAESYAPEEAY